jgi:Protein of unknown function (DUF2690)
VRKISRILRRQVITLVALCVAAGGVAVMAPPPAVAVPCTGSGCNGKDPDATGCNDPAIAGRPVTRFSRTVWWEDVWAHSFQIRHSPGCEAAWGRFIRDDCGSGARIPYHKWFRIQTQVWSGSAWLSYTTRTKDMSGTQPCDGGTNWTLMVPGQSGTRTRICWQYTYYEVPPSGDRWNCSSWLNGL